MALSSEPFDAPDELTYDAETETYRATFESSHVEPSTAVVRAMAHIRDTEPTQLAPLYDFVDTDTLDALVGAHVTRDRGGDLLIEFVYLDHRIRIKSYGVVEIRPLDADDGAD